MFDVKKRRSLLALIESLDPGPELAALLCMVDPSRLTEDDLVPYLQAEQRMLSFRQARVYGAIASVFDHFGADDDMQPGEVYDVSALEVGAALHLTRRSATHVVDTATDLRDRLPKVWAALARGDLDRERAGCFSEATRGLSDDLADEIVDRLIGDAPGLTTGQIIYRIRKLADEIDTAAARDRYEAAVEERRIISQQTPCGTVNIRLLDLPADRAAAADRHIDHLARSLNTSDEPRTMDQLRADVAVDLLSGHRVEAETAPRAVVDVVIPIETLAEASDAPGEIPGIGPVVADVARQVAAEQADAEWRFTVTDHGGKVAHTGITRRRPDTATTRRVQARNPRCVFPGCRMPARRCDLDHLEAFADGGVTCECNLAPLCRFHHDSGKHRFGWRYQRLPDGDYLWTSPLGRRYLTSGRPP